MSSRNVMYYHTSRHVLMCEWCTVLMQLEPEARVLAVQHECGVLVIYGLYSCEAEGVVHTLRVN